MEQVWLLNTCYDAPGEQSVADKIRRYQL